jgi:signal transduction histidine kinase
MKIILAEDTRSVAALMAARLTSFGHEVSIAENGQVACDKFSESPPDLVLMDIEMPVMNGIEATHQIRTFEATQKLTWTPIIFLTASDTPENLVMAIEAGGDDFLSKGLQENVLCAKMKAMARIAGMRSQLQQSEKMASIGQLAAGVAHEINNPIGFVFSNLGTFEKYAQGSFDMLDLYQEAETAIPDVELRTQLKVAREKLDVPFLKEDLHALIVESKDGLARVKKIVQNLKDFSHVDSSDDWLYSKLHSGIDSTLCVVNSEIMNKADVIKEYGELPDVECLPSQLNQVFMNILVNAAQAIDERGTITIRTGQRGNEVWVDILDNGKGIEPENIAKIFDPFFTTRPIGKGTGLGLSLSYGIVQKHHGRIEVKSVVGKGTIFRVWLPIKQPKANHA